jgi:predicted nucleotide-binding protein
MNIKDLKAIFIAGENDTTEFKRHTSFHLIPTFFGNIISAFANTKGGKIFIGISDQGITGIEKEEIERGKRILKRMIEKGLSPPLRITFDEVEIDETRTVLILNIPEGRDKPYGFRGGYYKREGSVTTEIAREDLISFFRTDKRRDEAYIPEIYKKIASIEEVMLSTLKTRKGTNVFISHGKHPEVLQMVEEFLESLELNPIIVKDKASEGLSVDDKVEKYIKKSECAIVLFTPDDELKDGTFIPRQNIIHEVGLLQREMPEKIIYLKDKNVAVPSNIMPKVYAPFENTNLSDAFIQIIRELKTMELI